MKHAAGARLARILPALLLCVGMPLRAEEKPAIAINGLVDWYFQHSFNHSPVGVALSPPRAFDIKNSSFSLSLLQVNISRQATKESPLGFTATLALGKTADLVHFTEPGGTQNGASLSNDTLYKYTQQLFGRYLTGKTQIDVGKFVTHVGLEVIESPLNDQYSRGLLFTYAIPFYHMGIRVSHPLSGTLTGQLLLLNGWNNVEDDNGGKTIGAQLNWTPTEKLNIIANYLGGDESAGAALPANLNVQLVDLVAVFNATDKLKLALNLDYASAAKSGAAGGNWSGWAVYGRYQATPTSAVALRWERFQDTHGLRTGASQNLQSLTLNYEYAVKGGLLNRLEWRRDKAGTALFPTSAGASRELHTVTYAQVYRF